MKTLSLIAVSSLLIAMQAVAEGQHHDEQAFKFDQVQLDALQIDSILQLNTDQLVFNDALAKVDWDGFFSNHTQLTTAEREALMHYAGLYSINPGVLVALLNVVMDADLGDKGASFGLLSSAAGFNEQLNDIAGLLTQRIYAFKAFELDNPSFVKRSLMSPANVALASLAERSGVTDLVTKFVAQYNNYAELDAHAITVRPKTIFFSEQEASVNAVQSFSMQLPWPSGQGWYSGGAHSNTGSGYPYSSLDFNNGSGGWGSNTPWVQAAHAGTVTRYSSCNIRVTHSSGYATQYYHMDSLQYSSGDYVGQGAWLGRYANRYNQALCQGGQSSGPHVHFSLLQNGYFVSLQNKYLSGYRVDVGNSNYDDNCNNFYFEKNGSRYCAWRRLYNN